MTSNAYEVERAVLDADLVIGAVLVPGAKAPTLVSNELVSRMKPGSVLVDISIDQGGCFEDSRPTTHADPTYRVHDSVFYCVANMPGAVPHTSTYALTNVTLPYAVEIANRGWREALRDDDAARPGPEHPRRRRHLRAGRRGARPGLHPGRRPCSGNRTRRAARAVPRSARCRAAPTRRLRSPAVVSVDGAVRAVPAVPRGGARAGGQHRRVLRAGPAPVRRRPGRARQDASSPT